MNEVDIIRKIDAHMYESFLENSAPANKDTENVNPFGDTSIYWDIYMENSAIDAIKSLGINTKLITEERGEISFGEKPEYIIIIDPLDGSKNAKRGIPLYAYGISIAKYSKNPTNKHVLASLIRLLEFDEVYIAETGKGATKNGKKISPSKTTTLKEAFVSIDTASHGYDLSEYLERIHTLMTKIKDMRRFGANLIDMVYVADSRLDAMVDLRGIFPSIHVSGWHILKESGAIIIDKSGKDLSFELSINSKMSFITAGTQELADEILQIFK